MKQKNGCIVKKTIFLIIINFLFSSTTVLAWGDNDGGRTSYTIEEIDNGAIGATPKSDGENYKNSSNYPGTIVFNSINVSEPIGGDERAFVAARENTGINAGKDNKWTSVNDVKVEDGKEYIVRMYVHNNNPNGIDAVAENTKVAFSVPYTSSTEVEINGLISSSNATPSRYWDYVRFSSDNNIPFHLEYIYGSAIMENNGIGANGGIQLSDDIVNAESGGILIGYDALDGKIPGCYQYASYVSIRVKAIFDYDFTVDKKVRIVGDTDKTWKESVEAKVGDKVEFQIQYLNTSDATQMNVSIRDDLPSNLRYVEGSAKVYNGNHPTGVTFDNNYLVDGGVNIGGYKANSNAIIRFTAEVVDDSLACGSNTLVNWAQVRVGDTTVKDDAKVIVVVSGHNWLAIAKAIIAILIIICIISIIRLHYKMRQLK